MEGVLLPDLTHVAHIPTVSHLGVAGLARYPGTPVVLTSTTETAATIPTQGRP